MIRTIIKVLTQMGARVVPARLWARITPSFRHRKMNGDVLISESAWEPINWDFKVDWHQPVGDEVVLNPLAATRKVLRAGETVVQQFEQEPDGSWRLARTGDFRGLSGLHGDPRN